MTTTIFPPHQVHTVLVVAISSSAFSMLAAVVAFYWFVRMERNFRHHLVILLLGSDLLKTLWYFIHPLVILANGSITSSSKFCQASGYLLAWGTQASDFAVLVIALHSAFFVFRSRNSIGEGGLYRYRYYVYAAWVIFPILTASLAFINPEGAYVTSGTFCNLPVRPFWYRLALAWIPRYIIFVAVCIIYISIYVYVCIKFAGFASLHAESHIRSFTTGSTIDGLDERQEASPRSNTALPLPKLEKHGLIPPSDDGDSLREPPALPKLEKHGLIPSSDDGHSIFTTQNRIRPSPISTSSEVGSLRRYSITPLNADVQGPRKDSSGKTSLGTDASRRISTGTGNISFSTDTPRKYSTQKSIITVDTSRKHSTASANPSPSRITQLQQEKRRPSSAGGSESPRSIPRSSLRGARAAEAQSLEEQGLPSSSMQDQSVRLDVPPLRGYDSKTSFGNSMAETRKDITRQLRFLFVYPLVYLILWTVPFVQHCLSYRDYYVQHPVYALNVATVLIVALRGAVDALIFCWRETPWKRVKGKKQKRLRNLGKRSTWSNWWRVLVHWWESGWNSRDKQSNDAVAAHRRSFSVNGGGIIEMSALEPQPQRRHQQQQRPEMFWWEEEGRRRNDSVWMGTGGGTDGGTDGNVDVSTNGGSWSKPKMEERYTMEWKGSGEL